MADTVLTELKIHVFDTAGQLSQHESEIGDNDLAFTLDDKLPADIDLSNITDDGRENVANVGMPSDRFTDLTLGASGNQYTAPADGWFVISKASESAGRYLTLNNSTTRIGTSNDANTGGNVHCYVPARKGDKVSVSYNLTGGTNYFRFIYADGARHLA